SKSRTSPFAVSSNPGNTNRDGWNTVTVNSPEDSLQTPCFCSKDPLVKKDHSKFFDGSIFSTFPFPPGREASSRNHKDSLIHYSLLTIHYCYSLFTIHIWKIRNR